MLAAVGANNGGDGERGHGFGPTWQSAGRPAPTIRASGAYTPAGRGGVGWLLFDDQPETGGGMTEAKPAYRVSGMDEIRALPWNGLTAASTFSGCGGSSLGYRMAGFRVAWASEFVPAARECYQANAAPGTVVDHRDIRDVTADMILTELGLSAGELDLLDGSPPCASFSTAGKREQGWGKAKKYSDTTQRTDDLFFEYARLVRGIQPRVFVAENVSGLVKGTAKGYFIRIMEELKGCGYQVRAKLLDAQWLGVPQARQRLILIGVRNDLGRQPVFPTPLPYRYSVREALPWVLEQGDNGGFGAGAMRDAVVPSGTIGRNPETGNGRFPPSMVRVMHDTSGDRSIGDVTDRPSPTITVGVNAVNSHHYQVHANGGVGVDPETGKDISIGRFAIGQEWERMAGGSTSDRYFSLSKPGADQPCPTVTAAGGGVSTASVTHPTVARKFTLGELRRICGFPDDFVLSGSYEQRWERLGRAVPPVMMAAIATVVRDRLLS